MIPQTICPSIYDHRIWRTGLPVRSAVFNPITLRGQSSRRPKNQNGKNICLRVSVGDICENSRDRGERGENK